MDEFAVVNLSIKWTYDVFGGVEKPIDAALAERMPAEQDQRSMLVSVVGSSTHWTL